MSDERQVSFSIEELRVILNALDFVRTPNGETARDKILEVVYEEEGTK